jgi:CxxC motif-containing protein
MSKNGRKRFGAMEEQKRIICVTCPKGCSLDVTGDGSTVVDVKQGCKKGHDYVRQEFIDPRRMVATTISVTGGLHPLLPVYTSKPFPKGRIQELMNTLRSLTISSPVNEGQVVLGNVFATGIDIIASRDI